MKQMRTVKLRRPALPPILEIDEDGLPVAEMSFENRRWTADGDEPGGCGNGRLAHRIRRLTRRHEVRPPPPRISARTDRARKGAARAAPPA